jgi:hypothetical protein
MHPRRNLMTGCGRYYFLHFLPRHEIIHRMNSRQMCIAKSADRPVRYRITAVMFCLLLLFLATGCPYESCNPLGKPSDAKIDEKLLGGWKFEDKEKKESGLVTISRFNDSELLIIIKDEGKGEQGIMRGFVTEIDGEKFLNLQDIKGGYTDRKWIFVRYATGECSLTYRVVNDTIVTGGSDREMSSGQVFELIKRNVGKKSIYDEGATLTCAGK